MGSFGKIASSAVRCTIHSEKELPHRSFVSAVVHQTQSLKTKYFLGSFGNRTLSPYLFSSEMLA